MKPFIYSVIFLFTIYQSFTQTKELVIKKSFEIDENTILEIDVDNASILFEESNDDKVHFDYYINFRKNSEEIQYKVFKGLNAKAYKKENIIKLDVKNSMYLGDLYTLDVNLETYKRHIKSIHKMLKRKDSLYKTKENILEEIDFSLGSNTNDYFKKLRLENPDKNYGQSSRKFKQDFVVKVPKKMMIKIKALHSRIDFTYNLNTPITINSFQTYFKFKKLENDKNKFNGMSGIFQAEKLVGGYYNLKNLSKVKLGEVSDIELETENSKIQFGEIGKKVSITDFDSKLYLYNFSNNFSEFILKGKYSKINLFKVYEDNFNMSVLGTNTTLIMKGNETKFGDDNIKEVSKILEKKAKTSKSILGNIKLNLSNSVLEIK